MEKKNILDRINHDDGMTVPEGYFKQFAADMASRLPEQPWEQEQAAVIAPPRTFWQRVRPYVYMAAMFAGVWLMMNMFSIFTPASPEQQLEANPVLAEALANEQWVEDLDLEDGDIDEAIDDAYSAGVTVDDLRAVFEEDSKI